MKIFSLCLLGLVIVKPIFDIYPIYLDSFLNCHIPDCPGRSTMLWWWDFRWYALTVSLSCLMLAWINLKADVTPLGILARYTSLILTLDTSNDLLWFIINLDQKSWQLCLFIYVLLVMYAVISFLRYQKYTAGMISKNESKHGIEYHIVRPKWTLLGQFFRVQETGLLYYRGVIYRNEDGQIEREELQHNELLRFGRIVEKYSQNGNGSGSGYRRDG